MPNGKTHFIAGAVVGATVNLIIQSAKMAMDYDREFDWGEFFLCAGAGAFAGLGPRLGRRPAAEAGNRETLPNLQRPDAPNLLRPHPDILEPATSPNHRPFLSHHRLRQPRRLGHFRQTHSKTLPNNTPFPLGIRHELPQPHRPRLHHSQTNQPHLTLCFCHFIFLPSFCLRFSYLFRISNVALRTSLGHHLVTVGNHW